MTEASITCAGVEHRLRHEDGQLSALDHPDPDGERLLVALGGATPRCLRLVELWSAHATDVRALTLGTRGDGDQPCVDVEAVARMAPTFVPRPSRREPTGLARLVPNHTNLTQEGPWTTWLGLLELLNLPVPLQVRWVAGVAAHLMQVLPSRPAIPAGTVPDLRANPAVMTTRDLERAAPAILLAILDSALVLRVRHALNHAYNDIAVHVAAPDVAPSVTRSGGRLELALHHDWLTRVWGRDLAWVGHRFVLDAIDGDDQTVTLLTDAGARTMKLPELAPVR